MKRKASNIRNAKGKVASEIRAMAIADYPDGSPDADFERFYHFGHTFLSYRFNTTMMNGRLYDRAEVIDRIAEAISTNHKETVIWANVIDRFYADWSARELKQVAVNLYGGGFRTIPRRWDMNREVARIVVDQLLASWGIE